jgi:hypothetical protein
VRRTFRFIDGEMVEITGDREPSKSFQVMPDIQPYKSMVTGEMINSRSQHREHLKAHRLVEIGNETKHLQPKPKELPQGLKQRIIEIANSRL